MLPKMPGLVLVPQLVGGSWLPASVDACEASAVESLITLHNSELASAPAPVVDKCSRITNIRECIWNFG